MSLKENPADVIHTKVPLVKIINERRWKHIFYDEIYGSIMKILNDRPMTINEVYEESKPLTLKVKSETSIYRYLKSLIDMNLVREVGHRVHPEKTFSKRLYFRSAEFILFDNADESFWDSEQGEGVALVIGMVLNHHFKIKIPIASKFKKNMLDIERRFSYLRETAFRKILDLYATKGDKQPDVENGILEKIKRFNAKDFYFFFNNLGIILGVLTDESILNFKKDLESSYDPEKDINSLQRISEVKEEKHDFIHFKPALIKPVDARIFDKVARHRNKDLVLRMLSSGPMTVNEIHDKYHKMILELPSDPNTQMNKKIPRKLKSKNTIYKYIQELIKAGFVVEAGRRPIPNQSATQKLYSKTAELIYRIEHRAEYWVTNEGKSVSYAIGSVLKDILFLNNKNKEKTDFNHKRLHNVIVQFIAELTKSLESALKEVKSGIILEYLRKYVFIAGQTSGTFLYTLGLVNWLIHKENIENFRVEVLRCFN